MSELVQENCNRTNIRWHLLASVSALALVANASLPDVAKAEGTNRPTVWIELGGQLERTDSRQQALSPSFMEAFDALPFESPLSVQSQPKYAYGAEGSVSFAPEGSNWIFSVGIRYGRANGHKSISRQTPADPAVLTQGGAVIVSTPPAVPLHINADGRNRDTHTILDFEVGKDVGLGLFGRDGSSIVSMGVRFAEFSSFASTALNGIPSYFLGGSLKYYRGYHHRYVAAGQFARSFRGTGPTLAWKASAPLFGDMDNGSIGIDWGVNLGVLFGRQKAQIDHQTTGSYYKTVVRKFPPPQINQRGLYSQLQSGNREARSRSVTIPNVGAFAGLSFRYTNARISLGYRADFFFGAMDGGIDTRKTYDRNFYGPFATVSIGLGG